MTRVGDLFEQADCQKVIVPIYLYILTVICVAFAVIELIIFIIAQSCISLANLCFPKGRNPDLQVQRLEKMRELEFEVEQ